MNKLDAPSYKAGAEVKNDKRDFSPIVLSPLSQQAGFQGLKLNSFITMCFAHRKPYRAFSARKG